MDNITSEEIEEINETPTPVHPGIVAVVSLYSNIENAQHVKGGLTMMDCKNLISARNILIEFFNNTAEPGENESNALSVFNKACNIHQSLGAFTINGAVTMLDNLETISNQIELRKAKKQKPVSRGRGKKI